jgi:hypothetical protein
MVDSRRFRRSASNLVVANAGQFNVELICGLGLIAVSIGYRAAAFVFGV